nr:hypothetical protein [Roseomonas mucosa]
MVSDARRLPDPREAAGGLPRGAAVLARDVAPELLPALARLCRARGLVLMLAGDGRAALGPLRWAALARRAASSAVALGGMDARSARRLPNWACGMAALEGLLPASHSVSQKSRPRDPGHCPFRMA